MWASECNILDEYADVGMADPALIAKVNRRHEVRDLGNKGIEALRGKGQVGSSLQANLVVTAPADDHALLASLGDDLKFIFITSQVQLNAGDELSVSAQPSTDTKCDRCWHWRADVGIDKEHPAICGRCVSNLFGAGETRGHA